MPSPATPSGTSSALALLPERLRARTRVLVGGDPRRLETASTDAGKPWVLYWMRVAARADENPALDAAVTLANALGGSVLVYQGVSARYPYASDRHHTFLLEGARSVARALRERGIGHALHVEQGTDEQRPVLKELAARSHGPAIVVTDEAPVPPLTRWTERLAAHLAAAGMPFLAVDASCLVPLPLVTKRYERAFAFRDATRALVAQTLREDPVAAGVNVAPTGPRLVAVSEAQASEKGSPFITVPFAPVDAEKLGDGAMDGAIADLVAACAIDHSVGPVLALRGGAEAGYARWEAFRREGLAHYAARRNDAAVDGTSRLSPWLHYGHISPFRIAREAARVGSASAEKFLDELVVWRELAWHFAAHTPDLHTLAVVPEWARETLAAHANQAERADVLPVEILERGRTGDRLWDLAQRSLLVTGELHNNVRMTWGKAIPAWTATPEAARETLVALNHRYALDGRDPASYGGLYWCLGLFDRPFPPAQPVLGTVRPRPTREHAKRLDLEGFAARSVRRGARIQRVAVVGGGLAGLVCARALQDHGLEVVVFDKGRAPGGRLGSRAGARPFANASEFPGGGVARDGGPTSTGAMSADLGAQYFTVRDRRFARHVEGWIAQGIVARWDGRIAARDEAGRITASEPLDRYVGAPTMNALADHLASDLAVRRSHRVDGLTRDATTGHYRLSGVRRSGVTLGRPDPGESVEDFGTFDALVVTTPPAQAAPLLGALGALPGLPAFEAVPFEACLALGFTPEPAFEQALRELPYDGLFVGRASATSSTELSWIARNSSKPGRPAGETWVVHTSALGARTLDQPEAVLAAAAAVLGIPELRASMTELKRWTYAKGHDARATQPYFDADRALAVGGDWTAGGRVEGAFLAGQALAGRILGLR